jgi:hypothetical protein
MFGNLKMIIATLAAGAVAGSLGYGVGHWRGEAAGAAKALLQAEQNFNKAVGELSNEADQARVRRRLCVDSGGVFNFATGQCAKAKAE